MIHNDNITFLKQIQKGRILALDISKKHIGLAITDGNLLMALPLKTIVRAKFLDDLKKIWEVYDSYNAKGIIIGLPLSEDGEENTRTQSIKDTASLILKDRDIDIFFQNEFFSTKSALLKQKEVNLKSKKLIDRNAATIFLQDFLDNIH